MRAPLAIPKRYLSTAETARVSLAYELHGSPGPSSPIIFLHGFLGSKRENRPASRSLARDLSRPVYALDLRNHGDSGHHPRHDYMEMALDVERFIKANQLQRPTLIGHSMGAKTALTLALHSPDLIKNVVAIDNCPIKLPLDAEFQRYLEGMAKVRDAQVKSHREADEILKSWEESPSIRLWLLSNFVREKASPFLKLRLSLDVLGNSIEPLGDFPYEQDSAVFRGSTLFLRARQSPYIPKDACPLISSFFPNSHIRDFDCGHWIVQDQPEEFGQAVVDFLQPQE